MFLGYSGTTSLGGKLVFFISFPSLPRAAKRRLAFGGVFSTSLPSELVSLQRSHGVRRHTHDLLGLEPSK